MTKYSNHRTIDDNSRNDTMERFNAEYIIWNNRIIVRHKTMGD